jgi:hypothetical protein
MPHLFLSKSGTKSAACDGPNGTRSPPGLVPVPYEQQKTNRSDFACRNVRNYKTYSECRESGLFLGWRNNEIWWYCTSLAAGQKYQVAELSDQDVGNNPTECEFSASPLWIIRVGLATYR